MGDRNLLHELLESNAAQVDVTVGITDTSLVPFSNRRVGLIIQAPLTNRITLSFARAAALDVGITLYPGSNPLYLEAVDYGVLLFGPIRCISAVAPQSVSYWETLSNCPCVSQ